MAVITNRETDRAAVQIFDVEQNRLTDVLYEHEKYDIVAAELDQYGTLSSIEFFEQGQLIKQFFTQNEAETQTKLSSLLPDHTLHIADFHESTQQTIVLAYSDANPGVYYLADEAMENYHLLNYQFPALSEITFSPTAAFEFLNDDNDTIEAYLTTPSGIDHNTLLIMPHGGPIGIRDRNYFDRDVQYLASRGFSVLRVNFRGSSGFGKSFQEKGVGQFGKAIEDDITRAMALVLETNTYQNICTIGASYGAYSAFMLAVDMPDKIDCVVARFGVYDLPMLFNNSNIKRSKRFLEAIEKVLGEEREELFDYSPVYKVHNLTQPILLTAGAKDEIASLEHTNRLAYMLNFYNKPFDSIVYPKAGHGHDTWYGNKHEILLISEFLYETLAISHHLSSDASEEEKAFVRDNAALLGDSFVDDSYVSGDEARAYKYYSIAAELGHPLAMFNVGAHYHRGSIVEENLETALEWYTAASEAGYVGASLRLGGLYGDEDFEYYDTQKAFQYLQHAYENDASGLTELKLASYYCLGTGVERNIEQCLFHLDHRNHNKNEDTDTMRLYHAFKENVAEILLEGQFTDDELFGIHQAVNTELQYDVNYPLALNFIDNGAFVKRGNQIFHDETLTAISGENGAMYGVEFEVSRLKDDEGELPAAIVVSWKRQGAEGEDTMYQKILFGRTQKDWAVTYKFNGDEDEKGQWTLLINDLFGNQLLSHNFAVN